jgi:hypothetical protein
MVRPKKVHRFKRIAIAKYYWIVYEYGVVVGHVTRGSGSHYYFTNLNGLVIGENLTSMSEAYKAVLDLRLISGEHRIVLL